MTIRIGRLLAVVCVGLGAASAAFALDPFDNWANPPGFYAVAYPYHVNGQELTDRDGNSAPGLSNIDMHVTGTVLRALYYNPHHWVATVLAPVGRMDMMGKHQVGMGDPTFAAGYFLVDDKEKNTYFGFGVKVDAPWGKYDKSSLVNMGKNYWRYRPMVCVAKLAGPVDFEATLTYDIMRENKEKLTPYGVVPYDSGDQKQLETFTGMFFSKQLMAGVHVNWAQGVDDKITFGGVSTKISDSGVLDWQLGGSIVFLPSPKWLAQLQVLQDVHARNTVPATLIMAKVSYKIF
jgi:hypothetical protein